MKLIFNEISSSFTLKFKMRSGALVLFLDAFIGHMIASGLLAQKKEVEANGPPTSLQEHHCSGIAEKSFKVAMMHSDGQWRRCVVGDFAN